MPKPKSGFLDIGSAPSAFPNKGIFVIDVFEDARAEGKKGLEGQENYDYTDATANGTQPKFATPPFANGRDERLLVHPADKSSDPHVGKECC